jgi:hypothetical protein
MAHKQRTPFTLKSGNAAAFKNMGSSSPLEQNIFNKNKPKKDLADTKIGKGVKQFFSDLKGASKVDVPRKIVSDLSATSKKVSNTVKNVGTKVATDVSNLAKTDVIGQFASDVKKLFKKK